VKQLYLIRHAKSSWSDPIRSDFDRPLNKRGKRDAPFMGQRLAAAQICPDLIISSSAKRARKTARLIASEIDYDKEAIRFMDELYGAGHIELLAIINDIKNTVGSLVLVGHNHGITEFAEWLTGATIVNIPTCGIVSIGFSVRRWSDIGEKAGTLTFFDYPKLHGERSCRG